MKKLTGALIILTMSVLVLSVTGMLSGIVFLLWREILK